MDPYNININITNLKINQVSLRQLHEVKSTARDPSELFSAGIRVLVRNEHGCSELAMPCVP